MALLCGLRGWPNQCCTLRRDRAYLLWLGVAMLVILGGDAVTCMLWCHYAEEVRRTSPRMNLREARGVAAAALLQQAIVSPPMPLAALTQQPATAVSTTCLRGNGNHLLAVFQPLKTIPCQLKP